jgi:hypothetical protein
VVAEAVSAEMDGQRSPISRWRMRRHLVACTSCREFALSTANLRLSMSDLVRGSLGPVRPVPSALIERLTQESGWEGRPGSVSRGLKLATFRPVNPYRIRRWVAATVPAGVLFATILIGGPVHPHLYPTTPTLCRVHPEPPKPR